MAKFFDSLNGKLQDFIEKQQVFFVATAASDGRDNLSPKGLDSLRVIDPNRLIWINLSGSGNETAAHLRMVNRMTLMFCAYEDPPQILRLYGSANTIHPRDPEWDELYKHFGSFVGARQIFDVQIESVQTSCGFGVPLFEFVGDRRKLIEYHQAKGKAVIEKGWIEKNAKSIDGLDTGIG